MIIVFDAFCTLVKPSGRKRAYRHLAGDSSDRLPFLTRNVPIDVFARELGKEHLLPMIRWELEKEIAAFELYDDVGEVLQKLRAKSLKVGVCSNLAFEYGPAVRALLNQADEHVFSFEVGAAKPDPLIYQEVCMRFGVAPRQIIFIGDGRRADLAGPQAFGMQARLIDRSVGQTLGEVLRGCDL
jgi:HAD superfamily hydrolase (TIGR01509 family)